MHVLICLSSLCLLLFTVAAAPGDVANDDNLFFDPNADALVPDSQLWLSTDVNDETSDPNLLLDDPNSLSLDWNDPSSLAWSDTVDLAGSDDLCAVDGELQYTGKVRRGQDANSCPVSDESTNRLNLPDLNNLLDVIKTPGKKGDPASAAPIPIVPASSPENDYTCKVPFRYHLCCYYPDFTSTVVRMGMLLYDKVRGCTPSQ